MRWRGYLVLCLCLAVLARVETASAQANTGGLAETLYRQGRELMDQKRYDEACKKFAESQRLDAATGTLLNLAACHEQSGRLATAWLEYSDALLSARRDQREDRVRYAEERIRELEPKLSRLTVVVSETADVPGLEVRVDGSLIGAAARGVPAPIDPGQHRIEATAPGKVLWSADVKVGTPADSQTVTIPALQDGPPKIEAAPPPNATSFELSRPALGRDELQNERPMPTAVYVVGGVTLACAVSAAITGGAYLSKRSAYNDANNDKKSSTVTEREDLRSDAQLLGILNIALTGAAVTGAVLTGVLYATRPERPASARAVIAPWLAAGAGGLVVSGRL